MYVKLKSGRAEGTCIVINLLQKALIAQTITFSHCWPCENLSSQISQLLSSQSYEWDFKLTNLADIFQDETSIAFLHRRQTSAKWEFKLANLIYIFYHNPSWNPANLLREENSHKFASKVPIASSRYSLRLELLIVIDFCQSIAMNEEIFLWVTYWLLSIASMNR